MGFIGMRFTLTGIPRRSLPSFFASAGSSFRPATRVYSMVMRRRRGKGYDRKASMRTGSGYFRLIGISRDRVSSSAA